MNKNSKQVVAGNICVRLHLLRASHRLCFLLYHRLFPHSFLTLQTFIVSLVLDWSFLASFFSAPTGCFWKTNLTLPFQPMSLPCPFLRHPPRTIYEENRNGWTCQLLSVSIFPNLNFRTPHFHVSEHFIVSFF